MDGGPLPPASSPAAEDRTDARLARAQQVLWWVLVALLAVLTATGVHLLVRYQPTPSQAWPFLAPDGDGRSLAQLTRDLHRLATAATIPVALALAIVAVARAARRLDGWRSAAAWGAALGVGVVGAALVGPALPWDQVALAQVTVGSNIAGYRWLLGDPEVRFVLIGGAEVQPETVARVLAAHLVLGALAIAATVGLRRRWQRSS